MDNCYKKHGFPPNYGRNSNANSSVAEDQLDQEDARSSKGTESYSFTKDQYEKLINLLQSSSAGGSSSNSPQVNVAHHQYSGISCLTYSLSNSTYGDWIVDSGASDHICSSITLFDSYHEIEPIQVKTANGSISYAKIAGTVKLSESLLVHDVLLVTDFAFNLIYVPRLVQSSQCIVVFDGLYCFIQEKRILRTIGSGELHEGLYYLNSKTKAKAIPTTPSNSTINHIHCASDTYILSSALWHFRLGHLSNKRLQTMKHDFPVVTVDNESVCDICHLARHRKLPFNSSVNKATKCGELIHFDIWGLNSIASIHGHKYFLTVEDIVT
jgi:hypothetical protein